MSLTSLFKNKTRSAASTSDQVIVARRCKLYGIYPELTTTGTITIADHATVTGTNDVHVCAIGLTQAGKTFGPDGIVMEAGIIIKQSVGTDRHLIVWEPI